MITVSIVDDESELRQSIELYLNGDQDFRCIGSFASGEIALLEIPKKSPQVVLMDINMTGMNGIECVRRLKSIMPDLLIVMLTVYEDAGQIFQALEAGASGYLLKRSSPTRLLDAIRDVHAGGSPMSSSIARKVVASFQNQNPPQARTPLSTREEAVLNCIARGMTYKQISSDLGITIPTIRNYLRRIYEKLHVKSRTEAVARYLG